MAPVWTWLYDVTWREIQTNPDSTPDRCDLGVLAGAANEVEEDDFLSWGCPRTQMGQGKPLVCIFNHAFRKETCHLAAFNRDYVVKSEWSTKKGSG